MALGLEKTLEILAETRNDAAVKVLVPALDGRDAEIRIGALKAILKRRSPLGQREVLRRLDRGGRGWKPIISEQTGRMTSTLRDAVLGSDPQMCANGCRAILWLREYELTASLVNAMEDASNPNSDLAAATLRELVELLYAELAGPRNYKNRRDPQLVRRHVTGVLEKSLGRFANHKRIEVVESFLMLASRENATLKTILSDPYHATYLTMVDALLHSRPSGVMRLLLSYLDDPHAPSAALSVLAKRDDPKFVRHLMAKIGYEPSATASHNLKRIESITWAEKLNGELLDGLDDAGQHAAVAMVMHSGMKRLVSFNTLEHLLVNGKPGGRRAAVTALAEFKGAAANSRVVAALEDDDPQVKAQAVRQIRSRGIPGAFALLIEMIDSPHEVVREAAREGLNEFSFDRFLPAFDTLDDEVRRSTGALVRKVDAECVIKLIDELRSPVRTRRLRGLRVAMALDVVAEVESSIIPMLRDEDHLVRLEAVGVLVESVSDAARGALLESLSDSSEIVKEAAAQGLRRMSARERARPAAQRTVAEQTGVEQEVE